MKLSQGLPRALPELAGRMVLITRTQLSHAQPLAQPGLAAIMKLPLCEGQLTQLMGRTHQLLCRMRQLSTCTMDSETTIPAQPSSDMCAAITGCWVVRWHVT